ncbi:ATP synthase subunit a [Candidatus Thermoflexus japonica]|uniref:ATP synthase subunit a n=1 Tax=Candidatus Thermoflexus japonica TaxID=2035417 RepID=A0A2H5Y3C0_9CHLR|nr:ATP synthase subunit a [Candidatus Thermoflexus japonica]
MGKLIRRMGPYLLLGLIALLSCGVGGQAAFWLLGSLGDLLRGAGATFLASATGLVGILLVDALVIALVLWGLRDTRVIRYFQTLVVMPLILGFVLGTSLFFGTLGQGLPVGGKPLKAVLPVILVKPEPLTGPLFFGAPLTNTMVAMVLVDLVVLGLGLLAARRAGPLPPPVRGLGILVNLFEFLVEALYENLAKVVLGHRARQVFPLVASIFLMVLAANWMGLLPGFDSIGKVEPAHGHEGGYAVIHWGPFTMLTAEPAAAPAEAAGHEKAGGEPHGTKAEGFVLVPYLRALSTDLNFTIGLALVAVFMVQVWGVRALGPGYFWKFFNVKALRRGFMGVIEFLVSLLEMISEVAKVLSFSFRLFGNIFAGHVLLGIMMFLLPLLIPAVFYGLEIFVGLIQAFIFMMLTMVFIALATAGHEEGHSEGHHS